MASRIKAIGAYAPHLVLGDTVQKQELVRYIAHSTGLSEGQIDIVIKELRDAIIFYNLSGRGVKIDGLGTYLPKIDTNGVIGIQHRADAHIKHEVNGAGRYLGKIANRENIGKTPQEIVTIWNTHHPEDPVAS